MTRDLLREATRALSESGHNQKGARFTKERLMASLHERKQRSKSRFAVLLPVAAIFVGSTAFAAVTGKLEVLVLSALDIVGARPVEVEEQALASAPHHKSSAASSYRAPARPPSEALSTAGPAAEATERATEPSLPKEAVRAEAPQHTATKPPASESDDAHAIYRRAHRAQFSSGDVKSALQDYDAYLNRQPRGRFAVDARYNRALCLVRLGRSEEARVELEKFAQGLHGGYRQHDAERLLAALDQAEPVAP